MGCSGQAWCPGCGWYVKKKRILKKLATKPQKDRENPTCTLPRERARYGAVGSHAQGILEKAKPCKQETKISGRQGVGAGGVNGHTEGVYGHETPVGTPVVAHSSRPESPQRKLQLILRQAHPTTARCKPQRKVPGVASTGTPLSVRCCCGRKATLGDDVGENF